MEHPPVVTRVDEKTLEVDGITFVCDWNAGVSRADRFAVMKDPPVLDHYVELLAEHRCDHVVEIGVREGGSTALLALLGDVSKLVAFELRPLSAPALVELIEQRELAERIRPYFGVDQSDRERIRGVVADEFGDAPLDLVVDDASHLHDPTLATFETLFPLVAPDGWYVIEDWCWEQHQGALVHDALGAVDPETVDEVLTEVVETDAAAAAKFDRRLREMLENPSPEVEALWIKGLATRGPELDATAGQQPSPEPEQRLLDLVFRLLLGVSWSREVITEVRLDPDWVMVRRGPAPLDPTSFRLADVAPDYQRMLGG